MKKFFFSLLLISFCYSTNAEGVLGGELTYKCLGNNEYEILVQTYHDCLAHGPIDIPFFIRLSTFKGEGNSAERMDFQIIFLEGNSIQNIPQSEFSCQVLQEDICISVASYKHRLTLPQSAESYHFVYQSCCRNNSVNNIEESVDVSMVLTTELTSTAQQLCNSSPVFNDYLPITICKNEPLEIKQSVTDIINKDR